VLDGFLVLAGFLVLGLVVLVCGFWVLLPVTGFLVLGLVVLGR